MKVYKAKGIEVRLKKDSGKVQIHLEGDAFISMRQFATMVRHVIAADRRRATGGKSRPSVAPQVVSIEAINTLKARQSAGRRETR